MRWDVSSSTAGYWAHLNLLAMPIDLVAPAANPAMRDIATPRFLVKAGTGGFAARIILGKDISFGEAIIIHVRADTWLANNTLRDDQVLLVDDGRPGHRLSDAWLMPSPFRHIVEDGDKLKAIFVLPSLPELIAKPRGDA